jgi:hypothetical protein
MNEKGTKRKERERDNEVSRAQGVERYASRNEAEIGADSAAHLISGDNVIPLSYHLSLSYHIDGVIFQRHLFTAEYLLTSLLLHTTHNA